MIAKHDNQKVFLVTGAASGIGYATAQILASQGNALMLVDRSEQPLKQLAQELGALVPVSTITADVCDLDALVQQLASTVAERGLLSGVVHCAGIEVLGTIEDLDPKNWARCIDVNLTGAFNVARAVIPELLQTRGSLVFIASDAGITGAQGYAAYCAAKHGVIGLMKAMALDYGPRGVRVNAVAPSFVETPMATRIFDDNPDEMAYYKTTVPIGRFARPEEISKVALHLLGDESSFTTGMVYRVDGGSTAGYFESPALVH
jgi:meso-butanediol dehydrogenase/(S,S)-butanediol dehydrogenase/diacetyl reductase